MLGQHNKPRDPYLKTYMIKIKKNLQYNFENRNTFLEIKFSVIFFFYSSISKWQKIYFLVFWTSVICETSLLKKLCRTVHMLILLTNRSPRQGSKRCYCFFYSVEKRFYSVENLVEKLCWATELTHERCHSPHESSFRKHKSHQI